MTEFTNFNDFMFHFRNQKINEQILNQKVNEQMTVQDLIQTLNQVFLSNLDDGK